MLGLVLIVASTCVCNGAPALDFLRQSAVQHAQARELDTTGEDLALVRLLTPTLPPDLVPVQTWVTTEARRLFTQAQLDRAKGRQGFAVKAYLRAVLADPALLGDVDHGLRDLTARALAQSIAKHADQPELRRKLAEYRFLTADHAGAESAFIEYLALEKDAAQRDRAQVWLDRARREIADAKSAAAADRVAAAAARAKAPPPEAEPSLPTTKPEGWTRRLEVVKTALQNIESQIALYSGRVKNSQIILNGGMPAGAPTPDEAALMGLVRQKKNLQTELESFK